MSTSQRPKLLVLLTMAVAPMIVSAQTPVIDPDLAVTVTADCFSICLGNANVKGVQGDVTMTNNVGNQGTTLSTTVKVQCNGSDVPGATQTLGPAQVAALGSVTLPYSIALAPVAGCTYRVVATATSSVLGPSRPSIVITPFAADCIDQPCGATGCTLTQGFWKTHPEEWPVSTLMLGSVTYTKSQLLEILKRPVKGNGLVSLAHQLIAAKLNLANGAVCSAINATIASADSLIGALQVPPVGNGSLSTSSVSSLVSALDQFNNGLTTGCAGHCSE